MAEYNGPGTLSTPGGDIAFNSPSSDSLWNDPENCSGLDMPAVRTSSLEDNPQGGGGLIQPFLLSARIVVFSGWPTIVSAGDETGYLAALDTLEDATMTALMSILDTDGSYSWTPRDGHLRSIVVRCHLGVTFTGPALGKRFTLGLVAVDPTIAVS